MYKSVDEWNDYLTKNLGISYADFMDMFSENMDIAPKDLIRQIKEKYPNEYKNYILPFETYLKNHQEG